MLYNIEDLPRVLRERLARKSSVRFNWRWVWAQWYTGMPVDYLLNLMDEIEQEHSREPSISADQ
jgi:hypothetical protein